MSHLVPEVADVLRASGWVPGRKVDTGRWEASFAAAGLLMHAPAHAFLREFGGLAVHVGGPGVTCARTPFELDPALARGEEGRFLEWGDALGRRLFPLGELDHGRYFLGIDELHEVYLVEAWVASFGPVPRALEHLVLGVAPRRIADAGLPAG
ncbi:hypothetical protein BJP40_18700 [Streptomyces sp. CC53]|uniref:SUKH-3 domain-containing protein n=1 Tax=unclassified Streptomyces TaxID=2593676 RepID=UPI0008DD0E14|nr:MULTISPECIES: SUKH-3 domain-containing protein [unclassified Streptomyces]OII65011.1 hypothetical protein BJP40_18700 [Streptomyces sp. CC53]